MLILFVAAAVLYLMARGCDGRGPEYGIYGLFLMLCSFLFAFAGLLGGAYLLGRYTARRP